MEAGGVKSCIANFLFIYFFNVQSLIFAIFTEWCICHPPHKETLYALAVTSLFPPTLHPQLLTTIDPFSLSVDLTILDLPYK